MPHSTQYTVPRATCHTTQNKDLPTTYSNNNNPTSWRIDTTTNTIYLAVAVLLAVISNNRRGAGSQWAGLALSLPLHLCIYKHLTPSIQLGITKCLQLQGCRRSAHAPLHADVLALEHLRPLAPSMCCGALMKVSRWCRSAVRTS
jgi:hypothetical protein